MKGKSHLCFCSQKRKESLMPPMCYSMDNWTCCI